jgi:hypothetical protein
MKTNIREHAEQRLARVMKKATSVADDLVLGLLYANLITVLETYLCDVTRHLVENDGNLLLNAAKSKMFKDRKLPIHFVLSSDPRRYFLRLVGDLNFHNLSDIQLHLS